MTKTRMLDQIWTFGARGGFKNDKKRDSHNVCVTLKIVRKRETGRSQQKRLESQGWHRKRFQWCLLGLPSPQNNFRDKKPKKIAALWSSG